MNIVENTTACGDECEKSARYVPNHQEKMMKRFRVFKRRRKSLVYFSLLVLLTFSVGMAFIFRVDKGHLHVRISEVIASQFPDHEKNLFDTREVIQILEKIQHHMMLVMFIVFLCVTAVMFVFIRNIVRPLDKMSVAAKRMADGHLDETVPTQAPYEICVVGELINDLAANLQEILLHVWNHAQHTMVLLDQISKKTRSQSDTSLMPTEIVADFECVRQDIEKMQAMVEAFEFYNIKLEKGKVVASENPRHSDLKAAPSNLSAGGFQRQGNYNQ